MNLSLLPAKRQSLLFSATFSNEIRTRQGPLLNDPCRLIVALRTPLPKAY